MSVASGQVRRRVFLYGYYGCGNIGDELLLNAAIAGILKHWPDVVFRVRNLGPVEVEPAVADRVELTNMERPLLVQSRSRPLRVVTYLSGAWRSIRGCDVFVLGGGTLISGAAMSALVLLTILIVLARVRGIPVIGIGLGIARIERWPAWLLTRIVLALVQDVAVRDQASLTALGSPKHARLTSDLVFSWWPAAAAPPTQRGHVIVVSLWSIVPPQEEMLIEALGTALIRAARSGSSVRFVVFQEMETPGAQLSDRAAIERVRGILAAASVGSEIVRPQASRASIAAAFAGARLHIGARFHAGVVAALLEVPSVGIALDPKIVSLGELLGLPVLQPAGVTAESIVRAIESLETRRTRREHAERLELLSAANFGWFAERTVGQAAGESMAEAPRP